LRQSYFNEQPLLPVTSNALPAQNLQEFIVYAKANQTKMQYGSLAGTGSTNHLVCAMFNAAIGVYVAHIPYRPPSSTAYQDLFAGRIDYVCPVASGDAKAHIEGNQFRGVAIFSKHRSAILPDLPTADEQGLAGLRARLGTLFLLPRARPPRLFASFTTPLSRRWRAQKSGHGWKAMAPN
jgi:tripartite-type tricarboxylate transporter receptor subunit TctC